MGSDHGGGSFKLTLQIANIANPNSKHNTCLLLIANRKDIPKKSLQTCQPFWQTIHNPTENMTSSSKYTAFQAHSPHIHASFTKHQNHRFRHHPISMMETLQNGASQTSEDNIRYRHSRKKIAKLYNNAIRRPLVNIELDHVAPPYLHILLGITKKHHDLLEDECHSLDKLIGQSLASSGKETPWSAGGWVSFPG